MLCCIVMVFSALAEYGLILWIKFHDDRMNTLYSLNKTKYSGESRQFPPAKKYSSSVNAWVKDENENTQNTNNAPNNDSHFRIKTFDLRKIDRISLIIFPFFFVIFNVVYWSIFF